MTFGLDMVILVGKLCLGKHQTLDETHEHICERLILFGVSISRREVLYLFDVIRTASSASSSGLRQFLFLQTLLTTATTAATPTREQMVSQRTMLHGYSYA